jgi:hypothetical protein
MVGNCLNLLTCHSKRLLVLIMVFHLSSRPKLTSVIYLYKSFDREFVKDHIIST